jgi:pimeloyl-ACP methyl ester carboxylesterase
MCCCLAGVAGAEPASIPIGHGVQLPAVVDLPSTSPRAVVVMVHGSGAHSKDEELGPVTEGKQPNPFFARLGAALNGQGMAVLRYDKRNYALKDKDSPAYQQMLDQPAQSFIADCRSALAVARLRFPGLPVLLLGHSEGTWVSLQAAQLDGHVDGLVEIGYSAAPLGTLVLEQLVYRPLRLFDHLDKNHDRVLQPAELSPDLQRQMPVIDLDHDGQLSQSEFQAGNWSNGLARPLISDAWRRGEAAFPDANALVQAATCPIVFLQGEWDNQTPAYGVMALELMEKQAWKKGNKHFHYFARAGHALDPRGSWEDTLFRVTPQATPEECARWVAEVFLPTSQP